MTQISLIRIKNLHNLRILWLFLVSLQRIIGMLEVKDATIKVGDMTLVTGFSMMANDGELTCITGSEGSGMTTLIRTLMGFLPVAEGFVSVDGELLTVRSAHAFRSMMAYLPQQMQMLRHHLHPDACLHTSDVDEYGVWNALLPSAAQEQPAEPLSPEEIFQLAEKTLEEAKDKPIVIADEPAALLPPELSLKMLQLLRSQADAGKTVLIASRKQQLVDYADQVINLDILKR